MAILSGNVQSIEGDSFVRVKTFIMMAFMVSLYFCK